MGTPETALAIGPVGGFGGAPEVNGGMMDRVMGSRFFRAGAALTGLVASGTFLLAHAESAEANSCQPNGHIFSVTIVEDVPLGSQYADTTADWNSYPDNGSISAGTAPVNHSGVAHIVDTFNGGASGSGSMDVSEGNNKLKSVNYTWKCAVTSPTPTPTKTTTKPTPTPTHTKPTPTPTFTHPKTSAKPTPKVTLTTPKPSHITSSRGNIPKTTEASTANSTSADTSVNTVLPTLTDTPNSNPNTLDSDTQSKAAAANTNGGSGINGGEAAGLALAGLFALGGAGYGLKRLFSRHPRGPRHLGNQQPVNP